MNPPPKKATATAVTRTGDWKADFLARLAQTGNVTRSARWAQVHWDTVYEHRKSDPQFASEWRKSLKKAGDRLEQEAWRRAVRGTRKPVYQGGKRVGEIAEYSDTLLIFLLKGCRPGKFRDNVRHEHTGKGGGPLKHEHDHEHHVTDLERCSRYFDEFSRRQLGGGTVPPDRN